MASASRAPRVRLACASRARERVHAKLERACHRATSRLAGAFASGRDKMEAAALGMCGRDDASAILSMAMLFSVFTRKFAVFEALVEGERTRCSPIAHCSHQKS